jgi:hypothetical protein
MQSQELHRLLKLKDVNNRVFFAHCMTDGWVMQRLELLSATAIVVVGCLTVAGRCVRTGLLCSPLFCFAFVSLLRSVWLGVCLLVAHGCPCVRCTQAHGHPMAKWQLDACLGGVHVQVQCVCVSFERHPAAPVARPSTPPWLVRSWLCASLARGCLLRSVNLSGAFKWLVRGATATEANMACVERLQHYSSLPSEPDDAVAPPAVVAQWPSHSGVELTGVVMRYRPTHPAVLQDVTGECAFSSEGFSARTCAPC